MRTYLLGGNGRFYKANLHCHSVISDGHLTPEALKEIYKSNGYSILAITDHEVLVDHSDLNDDAFLTLTAYEMALNGPESYGPARQVCHLNLFAREAHNTTQVFYSPEMLIFKNERFKDSIRYTGGIVKKEYSPEHINATIAAANANGFIVSYNHPTWSLETFAQYSRYEGLFAMEVYNTCCDAQLCMQEHNGRVYDEMLRLGKRIGCLATDDAHGKYPPGDLRSDLLGGWVMVGAEKLDYGAVIAALESGSYYASCGPEIKALYIEDGHAVLECAPAASIRFSGFGRNARRFQNQDGSPVTSARVPLDTRDEFFRFEVEGPDGKKAYTNAYFADQW